jgi:hypothetical protein
VHGTNTAALGFGGTVGVYQSLTELWNGSSWTEVNDLNSPKAYMAGAGTSTDALAFGGFSPALSPTTTAQTEVMEWNKLDRNNRFKYSKIWSWRIRISIFCFSIWWIFNSSFNSNRRMEWCRLSNN